MYRNNTDEAGGGRFLAYNILRSGFLACTSYMSSHDACACVCAPGGSLVHPSEPQVAANMHCFLHQQQDFVDSFIYTRTPHNGVTCCD